MSTHYHNSMKDDYSQISVKVAKKIKLERVKKDLSQYELALRAGIDKNTIWKIETCQVSPTIKTLEKIAHALDIDFLTLLDVSKIEL